MYLFLSLSLSLSLIYIYIYICLLLGPPVADPGRAKKGAAGLAGAAALLRYVCPYTVSFHNFKSQKFELSVSNPKNKYVAYSSVLSQISNCQGLGRKNKHEILKLTVLHC